MGMSVEAKTGVETDLRMLVCENQIAIYRMDTDTDTVSIARIINGRQDYMRILFGDMTEQMMEEELKQESSTEDIAMVF